MVRFRFADETECRRNWFTYIVDHRRRKLSSRLSAMPKEVNAAAGEQPKGDNMNDLRREIPGIHHITAIAGDPRENVEFYTGVLGLRMVKMTVNFDDPSAYHLYFGDELGRPGTALTFFSWPGARRGRRGAGQAVACSFSVRRASLGGWVW